MQPDPGPWIAALHTSHARLAGLVGPLDAQQVRAPAYPTEWSVAAVLSHLGSGAVIFERALDAAVSGGRAPTGEDFSAIWDTWNAKSPDQQVADAVPADAALVTRLSELDGVTTADMRVRFGQRDLDIAGFARMRLSEHAVHTWDVAVTVHPYAQVAYDAVALLVDTLPQMAVRAGKPAGQPLHVAVTTVDPYREFVLDVADQVTLAPSGLSTGASGQPTGVHLRLPAEAFVRLVYGRADPGHTPSYEGSPDVFDQVCAAFPGF